MTHSKHPAPTTPGSPVGWPRRASVRLGVALTFSLLALLSPGAHAQQAGEVTGRVVDELSQAPLASVQVYLDGTGLGTLTNAEGQYVITNVPAGSYTMRATRIGFRAVTQEVTVEAGEPTQADFTLSTEALALDEVVVTGTAGAARRREIGNTIAQLNMDEIAEPPVNTDALLQGRVIGMTVTPGSGSIGSGAQIRLRGNVSVAMSNQPILYVDGVRVRSDGYAKNVPNIGYDGRSNNDVSSPLNDINPADIERIEVIKGAAATTLYGTEAAAGVIQIFTKRGQAGQARWTAQIDQGVAYVQPFGPDSEDRPPSEPATSAAGGTPEYLYIDPWLRNAWQRRYSLSVGGGVESAQYFLSGTLTDNEGVLPNDAEEKFNLRGNFTFMPFDGLQLQVNTSFTSSDLIYTPAGNNAHGLTLNAFRRARNYASSEEREDIDPILDYELTTKLEHLITGLTATWSPTAGLTNRLTIGYDLAQQNNRNLRPFGFALAPTGILSDQRHRFSTLTADYVGTYTLQFGDRLRSNLSWGGQTVTTEVEQTAGYGEEFSGPGEPVVDAAATTLGFESRERVINAGFFFQNVFDLMDRYFLTVGVRVDGNSAFGENLGLQAYPKASFSWVASDEGFWDPAWGQLKLRAALGESGRAPGAFDAVRTFDPVGWGGEHPAIFPNNVGNADLGPERTREIELGFDGAFLGGRLNAEFTWFNAQTRDALFEVRQVPTLGFLNSQLENVGKMKNTGIELGVNGTLIARQNFGWELGGSVSTLQSEVLELGEGVPDFLIENFGWIVEGQPAPVIRARCVTNPDALLPDTVETAPDCNYGPALPTHTIQGFTTLRLPYGMSITARGEYQAGHYIYDLAAFNAVTRGVRWPGCFAVWKIDETQGIEQVRAEDRARCYTPTQGDFHIYPADFFKLRELTFQTPLPEALTRGIQATFTLSGRNIWKWINDDFHTFDPEMSSNDGFENDVRAISEHVPQPAVWTASLRFNF